MESPRRRNKRGSFRWWFIYTYGYKAKIFNHAKRIIHATSFLSKPKYFFRIINKTTRWTCVFDSSALIIRNIRLLLYFMLSWMCKSVRIFSTTEFFSFLKSHEGSIPFACSQRNKTHFFGLCWIEHIFSLIRLWFITYELCAYAMKPKFWYVKNFITTWDRAYANCSSHMHEFRAHSGPIFLHVNRLVFFDQLTLTI